MAAFAARKSEECPTMPVELPSASSGSSSDGSTVAVHDHALGAVMAAVGEEDGGGNEAEQLGEVDRPIPIRCCRRIAPGQGYLCDHLRDRSRGTDKHNDIGHLLRVVKKKHVLTITRLSRRLGLGKRWLEPKWLR
eukprot:CAMPEP_0113827966 /NCGR_PEP_ID=MMETSP0328-20130328/5037_1 /TAXON_ID=39455 /ORGANISM="Alexandrium minutum" /LENGTH=134 /DNA_ID=CAMNT_0000795967 /DNA_START=222 /DNA_END=624 /DNA_ORIENTATION=- /assembly_acc=CAM_ASM_000350